MVLINPPAQLVLPELPQLPEGITVESPSSPKPPPPIEKDPVRRRSQSSTRRRPPLPTKEKRRSRGSTLQLVSTNPDLLAPPNGISKKRPPRKRQNQFLSQLTSIKSWFKESAKRAKSPTASRGESSTLKISPQEKQKNPIESRRSPNHSQSTPTRFTGSGTTPTRQLSAASYNSYRRPQIPTPRNRSSLSPAPITPRSSYRVGSGASGLRGRKSTSSSVSSIRSIHHLPSHSKASSTSSTANSVHSSIPFSRTSRSPHTSVKVLPSTPTVSAFPSNVRLVRAGASTSSYNESANFSNGANTGLVFAKRKKTPFRGPMLPVGTGGNASPSTRPRDNSTGRGGSRSTSVAGRRSGEVIEEEDEEEVEEVDVFSPIAPEAEETIWEGGKDSEPDGWIRRRHE